MRSASERSNISRLPVKTNVLPAMSGFSLVLTFLANLTPFLKSFLMRWRFSFESNHWTTSEESQRTFYQSPL